MRTLRDLAKRLRPARRFSTFPHRAAGALLAALLLGGCTAGDAVLRSIAGPQRNTQMREPEKRVDVEARDISRGGVKKAKEKENGVKTLPQAGSYLAARHAQSTRDLSSAAEFFAKALAANPDDHQLLRRTLVLMTSEGRIAEAERLARRELASGSEMAVARLVLAITEVKKGDYSAAQRQLDALGWEGPNTVLHPLLNAWAAAGKKQREKARLALRRLAREEALIPIRRFHEGLIDDLLGKPEAAEANLKLAAEKTKDMPFRLVDALGRFYERHGRGNEAKALYETYREGNPGTKLLDPILARLAAGDKPAKRAANAAAGMAEALLDTASLVRNEHAGELALVLLRLAIHLRPDFSEAQVVLADILESQNRYREAIHVYEHISPKAPFKSSASLRIALAYDALGETDKAVALLEDLARDERDDTDALIRLGDMLRFHERFSEAAAVYDRAIKRIGKLKRKHWPLLYARGISLQRSKQWPRAEDDFLSALKLNPDQPYVLNYLGYSWTEKGVNLKRAREMIERAVRLRPNDGYIVDSFGWVLYRSGEFEGAVRHLEQAVELMPEDATINDHLGDAYWQVGRKYEARFQWHRALGMEPEPALADSIQAKLARGLVDSTPRDGNNS